MTRQEALNILAPYIPSMTREYFRWGKKTDKEKDRSWLYRDDYYAKPDAPYGDPDRVKTFPEKIPVDFLEGLEAEFEGKTYVAKRDEWEKDYRRVYLEIVDFGYWGNKHKYGKLQITGLHWSSGKGGMSCRQLSNVDPRVTGIWDVDICRIVAEGELDPSECPPGESSQRFDTIEELIATAAYVALLRVEGPIKMDNASSYASAERKDDMILTVDKNDNVTFEKKLLETLNDLNEYGSIQPFH